jgi:hypothetical protein
MHTIEQQYLEVEFRDRRAPMGLQDQLAIVYKERILPLLETVLQDNDVKDYIIQVDAITIDAGILSAKNWEQELTERAVQQFKKMLQQKLISPWPRKAVTDQTMPTIPVEGVLWTTDVLFRYKALVQFLTTGYLPAQGKLSLLPDIEAALLADKEEWQTATHKTALLQLLLTDVQAWERFMRQCPEALAESIVRWLSGEAVVESLTAYQWPPSLGRYMQRVICYSVALWQAALKDRQQEASAPIALIQQMIRKMNKDEAQKIRQLLKKGSVPIPKETLPVTERLPDTKETSGYHIGNAGLVILHPFLQTLFTKLGLLDKYKQWNDAAAHQRAVLLCQYLVQGEQDIPEYQLPLNKVLCGYPLQQTLDNKLELTTAEKEEAEKLLLSVLEHWSVLKNTSIPGLQQTFLQRSGKLSHTESGWQLQVEQKVVDVLMQSIPWTIGRIKTPWMQEGLIVDWV